MMVDGVTTNEGGGLLIGFWAAINAGIGATVAASKIPYQPLALVRKDNTPADY